MGRGGEYVDAREAWNFQSALRRDVPLNVVVVVSGGKGERGAAGMAGSGSDR